MAKPRLLPLKFLILQFSLYLLPTFFVSLLFPSFSKHFVKIYIGLVLGNFKNPSYTMCCFVLIGIYTLNTTVANYQLSFPCIIIIILLTRQFATIIVCFKYCLGSGNLMRKEHSWFYL